MEHSFKICAAKEYGILEAVLLHNFQFWLSKNAANDVNFHDGSYWTYNSIKAFAKLFPYASEKQIRKALKNLVDAGLIKTGNYNKSSYDRTMWYAFTEKGISIFPIGQMEEPKKENGNDEKGEPIPDNKPNINPDIKPDMKNKDQLASEFDSEFEELWKSYPKKQGKANARKAYFKARKNGTQKAAIEAGLINYNHYVEINRIDPRFIKQGSTWFTQECWNDEYIETRSPDIPAPTKPLTPEEEAWRKHLEV